jgi:lysophospholipase L1-like esterase
MTLKGMKAPGFLRPIVDTMRVVLKPVALSLARLLLPDAIQRLAQLQDWAQLGIYHAQNQAVGFPALDEDRVVFFGDSITEFWDLAAAFPQQSYLNRGIAGQTTAQMLLRFRCDVISLQPKVVLILAGTNDLAGNTGAMTIEQITDNYASIAELAAVHQIRVIFASVLPIHDYGDVKQSEFRSPLKIQALNQWLKRYCQQHHLIYLDYYSAMVDTQGMLKVEFSEDGVHPNAQGYTIMAPLAETAIQTAF